jgi:carboxyl-terminal processing protease
MTKNGYIPRPAPVAALAAALLTIVGSLVALLPAHARAAETAEAAAAPHGSAQLTLDDLRTFTDVFNQVRRNYVEDVDDRTLLDSAIRGMLLELDPHSAYLPGAE